MELQQIDKAINFSNELMEEINNNFHELLLFLDEFNEIYIKEVEKLPYHINLIDELRANENAHSRILGKLLQQQDPKSNRYEILESFLKYIIDKYDKKEDFCKIKITKPRITQEKGRIDLWIRDTDYTIILENKVGWATDQLNQLERYIDLAKKQKFKEEQIYILYLPPTYDKIPDEQTWGKYLEHDIFNKRYLNLSFKDDILHWLKSEVLHWLKSEVLPGIKEKDRFLSSAIEQYIDHLEGIFGKREINNKMNMKLQKYIKEKLGINEVEPELALQIVSEKHQEMENALKYLAFLKEEIQADIDEKYFSRCYKELKELNLNVIREIEGYDDYHPTSVGVKLANKLTVWFGKDEKTDERLFWHLHFNGNHKKLTHKVKQNFKKIFNGKDIGEDRKGFEIWAYIENNDNAVAYLEEVCEKMSEI